MLSFAKLLVDAIFFPLIYNRFISVSINAIKGTTMKRLDQKGFSATAVLIVIVVVGLLGVVGWLVYDRQKSPRHSESTQQLATSQEKLKATEQTSAYTTLKLAGDKVQFEIPKSWAVGKSSCIDVPSNAPACADGATLVPPEKMSTIYGGGTEYFTIYAQVYDNKESKTAQRWFEDVYQGGSSLSSDKVSSKSINGYSTYYFRQVNTNYDEIRYVYSSSGKAVMVIARVSEKGFASDGSGRVTSSSDFTRYIPEIEKMANTIKIN